MFYASNMSAEEEFRITGTLNPGAIETLLDRETLLRNLDGIDVKIEEGMAQFPSEDFLQGTINRLHQLAKKLRGENRLKVLAIIECLDDLAQCTFNAADYGRSELKDALKMYKDAVP